MLAQKARRYADDASADIALVVPFLLIVGASAKLPKVDCIAVVIASEAKQSRFRARAGLLRRYRSSQ
jgi:hypothetical protein